MSARRVILHVGTPKSGTTYLQDLLWESRSSLAEAGVLYPGAGPEAHFQATLDLKQDDFNGWDDPAVRGAWNRLVEAARAHEGTTVISHELFGDLPPEVIARVHADLDFAEVHVVVTARDLARQLPAVWQEDVKNRHFMPFDEFVQVVQSDSWDGVWYGRDFWLRHDVPAVVRRWAAGVPADRVHLVTVPQRGADPEALWQRFAGVVGVDPALAVPPGGRRNKSLGRAEAELLRRLNERLDYGVDWPTYAGRITHHVAANVLAERPSSGSLAVAPHDRPWVAVRAAAMVEDLRACGCRVVGDLDELLVHDTGSAEAAPAPTADEMLDAALDALIALIPTGPPAAPQEPESAGEDLVGSATPPSAAPEVTAPAAAAGMAAHAAIDLAEPVRDRPRLPRPRQGVSRWLRRFSEPRPTDSLTPA